MAIRMLTHEALDCLTWVFASSLGHCASHLVSSASRDRGHDWLGGRALAEFFHRS